MYGKRLKEIRNENNLTQKKLGELLGVNQRTISQYEKEDREISIEIIIKICTMFKISADYLIGIDKELDKEIIEKEEFKIQNIEYKRSIKK